MQQAVGALAELDEGAEVGDLDDLAAVLVADLDLLVIASIVWRGLLGEVAGAVDADRAVFLDVDLDLVLVLEPADGLAALADQQPDVVGRDLRLT